MGDLQRPCCLLLRWGERCEVFHHRVAFDCRWIAQISRALEQLYSLSKIPLFLDAVVAVNVNECKVVACLWLVLCGSFLEVFQCHCRVFFDTNALVVTLFVIQLNVMCNKQRRVTHINKESDTRLSLRMEDRFKTYGRTAQHKMSTRACENSRTAAQQHSSAPTASHQPHRSKDQVREVSMRLAKQRNDTFVYTYNAPNIVSAYASPAQVVYKVAFGLAGMMLGTED